MQDVVIYGTGGFGREAAWLVGSTPGLTPVAFADDGAGRKGLVVNGLTVYGLEEARAAFPSAGLVVALGQPEARERVVQRAAALGFSFPSVEHPRVERSEWVEYGPGVLVCAGCILTTNITLGPHVHVNLDCTIGHDVRIGEFSTLSPGVHVSGWVHIGRRAYVGTGAVIINGAYDHPLTIGDGAVIGAAACVTRNVESGTTVVGVPARPMRPTP